MSEKKTTWSARWISKIKNTFFTQENLASIPHSKNSSQANLSTEVGNYFKQARSWADDVYTAAIVSRNRYQCAFVMSMGLSLLLVVALIMLLPLQKLQPLLINHYTDGGIDVLPMHQPFAPTNAAEVESDLVRYVINRESYDPTSYDEQYSLINLLSNNVVASQYQQAQSTQNKNSPIVLLGDHGFRTVHVDSVVFLDTTLNNKNKSPTTPTHHNVAQINFSVTDHVKDSDTTKTLPFTALLSW